MASCTHSHDNTVHGVHDHADLNTRLLEAESLCSSHHARLTPLRKEVLSLILQAQGPIGAYDILAQIKNTSDKPAAPPTVYRSLDFLLDMGLIHRLSSINAFIPCCHPREGHQAAFLICSNCKAVKEASADSALNQLYTLADSDQFKIHHTTIEISGTCNQCNQA
ncbi:transcriptional repressor [Acinetobacter boissieri]|uniref:Fur family transcriptional regulator, zinc uptake regulator n=1 Tax=Acinetobacter boissieri TaxID=1219383 RepID=A0A1G6JFH4_9GAMM|nr:transcriptional repressor [Acinetobacter boissieri]SDC17592.1 Fur family transcriptional regulator, zinc uptake regulator [Acinetobacter boissieri]